VYRYFLSTSEFIVVLVLQIYTQWSPGSRNKKKFFARSAPSEYGRYMRYKKKRVGGMTKTGAREEDYIARDRDILLHCRHAPFDHRFADAMRLPSGDHFSYSQNQNGHDKM